MVFFGGHVVLAELIYRANRGFVEVFKASTWAIAFTGFAGFWVSGADPVGPTDQAKSFHKVYGF